MSPCKAKEMFKHFLVELVREKLEQDMAAVQKAILIIHFGSST